MANDVYIEGIQYNSENNNQIKQIRLPKNNTSNELSIFYATNDADATSEDVVNGKIFYNENGKQIGTGPSSNFTEGQAVGPRYKSSTRPADKISVGYSLHPIVNDYSNCFSALNSNYTYLYSSGFAGRTYDEYKDIRNAYKSPEIIDLGDSYFLLLHRSLDYSFKLQGTVMKESLDNTENIYGNRKDIGEDYSGYHFSGVALTTGAAEYSNLTTEFVFVCYNKSDDGIECALLQIDKENKTFTILKTLLLNQSINGKTIKGDRSLYCTIMNYDNITNSWYILIAHSVYPITKRANSRNYTEYGSAFTGIKININKTSVLDSSISYGSTSFNSSISYIPAFLKVITDRQGSHFDNNIKVIRIDNNLGFCFFPSEEGICVAAIQCPYVTNYTESITISDYMSVDTNACSSITFDAIYIDKKEIENNQIQYYFCICYGLEKQAQYWSDSYPDSSSLVIKYFYITKYQDNSFQFTLKETLDLGRSNSYDSGGTNATPYVYNYSFYVNHARGDLKGWMSWRIKCLRINQRSFIVFHSGDHNPYSSSIIQKPYVRATIVYINDVNPINGVATCIDVSDTNNQTYTGNISIQSFDARVSIATGHLICIGYSMDSVNSSQCYKSLLYSLPEKNDYRVKQNNCNGVFGETEYDNSPFNNEFYKTRFYNSDPTKTADIFKIDE